MLKNGNKKHFDLNHYKISSIRSITEFQLAQISLEKLELRLVISKSLNNHEVEIVNTIMEKFCDKDFVYEIIFCQKIKRANSGKLIQFVSEIKYL